MGWWKSVFGKTELSSEDRPRVVHNAEKDGAPVATTLWFFGDYVASVTKAEGPYFVPQFGDPDSPGPTYITEFKLWRALDSDGYASHVSKVNRSTEAYFYKEMTLVDVNARFGTHYVLQLEASDLSSHTRVDKSEKALFFTTVEAVLAYLHQHLGDKLMQELLSGAAENDPAFPDEWDTATGSGVRFAVDQGDGTIYVARTKLAWLKDAGYAAGEMTWDRAVKYIDALNTEKYLGYDNWRLPTEEEMKKLVANRKTWTPIFEWLQSKGFMRLKPDTYWASITERDGSCDVCYVHFDSRGPHNDGVVHDSISRVWVSERGDKSFPSCLVWPVRSTLLATPGIPRTPQERHCG